MRKIFATLMLATTLVVTSCAGTSEPLNLSEDTNPVWVKGQASSEVVLQEFSDFQCPACRAASGPVKEVVAELGDQIRFEYKHFPLTQIHKHALAGAYAAEAAGRQNKFWEMHDMLFAKQTEWGLNELPASDVEALFMTYAEELGLDAEQFAADMKSDTIKKSVERDVREAMALKLNSTPSFVMNGMLVRPRNFDELQQLVREGIK